MRMVKHRGQVLRQDGKGLCVSLRIGDCCVHSHVRHRRRPRWQAANQVSSIHNGVTAVARLASAFAPSLQARDATAMGLVPPCGLGMVATLMRTHVGGVSPVLWHFCQRAT